MYVYCIVGDFFSTSFLSFSLLGCSTRRLFSNSSRISFCPDAVYYDNWAFASFFVYLFIRKQISDGDVM